MRVALHFAKIQLMRVLHDPITLAVLLGIPVLLLIIFGTFLGGDTNNVSLRVAIINQSDEVFAKEFVGALEDVDVFSVDDNARTLSEAEASMKEGRLDGIVLLPEGFGAVDTGTPTGSAKVIVSQSNLSTGDIMMGVMKSIVDETNKAITGSSPPIAIERTSIEGTSTRIIDTLYAMFTAMAIMMVGIFGVASTIPSDKKSGILRRMRVTPFRAYQLVGGTVIAYLAFSVLAVSLMTVLAVVAYKLEMHGSWLDFGVFVLIAAILMIAIGVMVGGWAKNTTQSDIYGQIIFITSLAFSGLWVPRALMPEWLQDITSFFPLTPVIEGIGRIVTEGASLGSLGVQLAIIAGWIVLVFILSVKTFRWE